MPTLLDLFCGAGGASVGYAKAGFDVTGVDWEHHDAYPDRSLAMLDHGMEVDCTFMLADALEVLRDVRFLQSFDVIAASPPCPFYSTITKPAARSAHPDLIPVVREALEQARVWYVIENVEGARQDMKAPVLYCGSSFGLKVRRHRLFESNAPVQGLLCDHKAQGTPVGVYGDHPDPVYVRPNRPGSGGGVKARTLEEGREAMGIPWMHWPDLADAIPPVYTQHIGRQLMDIW